MWGFGDFSTREQLCANCSSLMAEEKEGPADAAVVANPLHDDDILREILLRLPSAASLAQAALVSGRWRRIASDSKFLCRFRERHPSSPLVGLFASDDGRGCAPWPHFYPALSGRGSDPDITAVTRKGDFFLTRFDGEPSLRLRDCRNGLLLLSLEDSSLCIYDPVSKRRVGIPRRPHDGTAGSQCLADCLLDAGRGTGTSSTVRQCGQRMMPQAMESFRVVSLQQQSQEIRALVYDSNTLEWHHHPWVSPPTDGIKRLPKWGTTAMYAAGNVFWRCAQQSLVLVLETSTMEFSLRPLPPDLSFHVPSRYAIGEIEDGKGCLVCLTGLTGEETPTLEVWVLDTNMWKLHSSLNNKLWKLDSSEKWWRLEKKIPVSQLLGESARVRQVRMVINGLALLCKDDHDPQFVVDLQSMALLAKFQFRGYPYQMSWPPAGLATTNSRSTSSLEDTNIDIAPVLPEGELSESGSRKKSDESGMHLEESCNRGFKLNGDGDHEVGNLRKYHEGTLLQSENARLPEMEMTGSTSSDETLLDSMLNFKDKDGSHLINGIQAPLVSTVPEAKKEGKEDSKHPTQHCKVQTITTTIILLPNKRNLFAKQHAWNTATASPTAAEVHSSQTPLSSEQHGIGEKSSQDLHGCNTRIQPMEKDPCHDELTLQTAGVFPSESCDGDILGDKSETDYLPKNTREDTEMLEQQNSDKANIEVSCVDKMSEVLYDDNNTLEKNTICGGIECHLALLDNKNSEARSNAISSPMQKRPFACQCHVDGCTMSYDSKNNLAKPFREVHKQKKRFARRFSGCSEEFSSKNKRKIHEGSSAHVELSTNRINCVSTSPAGGPEAHEEPRPAQVVGRRTSNRPRKPNKLVSGDDWVV
ncbi:uncharacterized protein [Triticum aestivum]|uniref:uncharacterized protein isoform X6 n=1 Tax=Triticum aestivum TaxID=4565 RepID=UPI001D024116|nr:uncharacterized protein LOC123179965 isoform X6 [Triticum aestivum]